MGCGWEVCGGVGGRCVGVGVGGVLLWVDMRLLCVLLI